MAASRGLAPEAYWNMAGPFGGTTAAVLLRAALLDQPEGVEPVALTVNYCAAVGQRRIHDRRPCALAAANRCAT